MSTKVRRRDGGYATFPNRWIDAGYMAKAPGSVTQVYLFLCRWADNSTLEAAQPMRLIALKSGLTEDVARKAVRTLEAWGVVTREPESGPNAVNLWTLNELPPECPDYPDKVPPKESGGAKSGGAKSQAPYQPNSNQPNSNQPNSNQPEKYQPENTVAGATKPKRRTTKSRYEDFTDAEREMFDTFWSAYPHYPGRSKKAEAVVSWHRLNVSGELFMQIMDALAWFKRSPDWTRDDGQAIPGAQVWLNQERWQDAQGTPAPPNITPLRAPQQEVDTNLITFPDGTTDRCPEDLYGTDRLTWFRERLAEWRRNNPGGPKR